MSSTERLTDPLGVSANDFFYSDTLLLYGNGERKPFGYLRLKDGKSVLHVGSDVDVSGYPVTV